jgi:shikimate dehydrogenase
MMINAETRVCAVIGNPIAHSLSPLIHNAAFREKGLNYVYVAFQVEELKDAIAGVKALGIRGLSVTIPHKIEIVPYLDDIDSLALAIGSVNTVVNSHGRLKGYNSDGPGALKALMDAGVILSGSRVVIIGSGGAARAVAFTLARDGKLETLTILGILTDQVEGLIADVRSKVGFKADGGLIEKDGLRQKVNEADILINCSPVGMYPRAEESPLDRICLRRDLVVFDIVYNPLKTRLLRDAEEMGCKTVPGSEMFLNQAAIQFELFTGVEPPVESMRNVLLRHLQG